MQHLAWFGHHSEHVIFWCVRRDREPMKMQVRHIHARTHRTSLGGFCWEIVDISDFQNVARGSSDHGGDDRAVEGESVPAIFVHCMQRERYDVMSCSQFWRLRQRRSLGPTNHCEKYVRSGDYVTRVFSWPLICHREFLVASASRSRAAALPIQATAGYGRCRRSDE